jgi:hypothetical protein
MFVDQQIQYLASTGKAAFKKHAIIRMIERQISVDEVLKAVSSCETIQDYPADRPLPSRLVLGFGNNRPIHAVVAVDDNEILWIITVYVPSLDNWDDTFKIRRSTV